MKSKNILNKIFVFSIYFITFIALLSSVFKFTSLIIPMNILFKNNISVSFFYIFCIIFSIILTKIIINYYSLLQRFLYKSHQ